MAELSEAAHYLIGEMKARGVDKDSAIGVMIELSQDKDSSENNFASMLEWLKSNPEAGQVEIFNHIDEMGL